MDTLVVDCGGLGLKAGVLDATGALVAGPIRRETPYPLPPALFANTIAELAAELGAPFSRASIGLPGILRDGRVIYTPHYVTVAGPHTAKDQALTEQWTGLDLASLLHAELGVPVAVMNDAELHGYGVISGTGLELVLTFGTGLGSAMYVGGRLAPHLEISHAPVRIGEMVLGRGRRSSVTYDHYIGDKALRKVGADHWSDRLLAVVDSIWPVVRWDSLYLGGGNAARIAPWAVAKLPANVRIVPNEAALVGGVRVWDVA